MLRAVIIDDELIGINTLKLLIEKNTNQLKVIAFTCDPIEGIQLIESLKPDVVFLDVSMPKMNGFELLDQLSYKQFKLVFTTAHQGFALQAIKNRAQDFLLKPIDIDELRACLKIIIDEFYVSLKPKSENLSPIIDLSVKDGIIFIKQNDIIRLEASGSYCTFYLENKIKHIASKNLKECELMLNHQHFFRCHLSHIVNLNKVVKMVSADGLFAQMTDGSMPEISRKNKEIFLEKLKNI